MKVSVDVDCTPEEARRFLGLPDLTPVNETLVSAIKQRIEPERGTVIQRELYQLIVGQQQRRAAMQLVRHLVSPVYQYAKWLGLGGESQLYFAQHL